MNMQGSGADRAGDGPTEVWLHQTLYRVDCPPPQTLGEWNLQLLGPEAALGVAQHVRDCDLCQRELDLWRSSVRQAVGAPHGVVEALRRVVARLVPPLPTPAFGGLRGSSNAPPVQVYEVDDVTITIGRGQSSNDVIGLVLATEYAPEDLVGQPVRLLSSGEQGRVTELDDIGNFSFDGVSAGRATLEIELPSATVVIEELQVG
ncbi:MAG: hypothetical protein NVSMB2_19550 [Chloroflexota bacterium]